MKSLNCGSIGPRLGHSLRGECGLKFWILITGSNVPPRHSLRGECGLKSLVPDIIANRIASLSARRVWIEIWADEEVNILRCVTLCEESVD